MKVRVGWTLAVGDGDGSKTAAVESGAAENSWVGVGYTPHRLGTGAHAVSNRSKRRMSARYRRMVLPS